MPEVERGADALGGQRAGSGRRGRRRRRRRPRPPARSGGGSSCPGSAPAARRGRSASAHRRVLDVVARVERADADAQLVAGRERPAVARAARSGGRATARGRRRRPCGCTSRPRDSSASGGWTLRRAPSSAASPARRRSAAPRSVAAVGVDDVARSRPSTFAVSNSRRPHCSHSSSHSVAVVEGRERPRQRPARRADGVWTTSRPNVWRIEPLEPEFARATRSGAAHADVWRSPIS